MEDVIKQYKDQLPGAILAELEKCVEEKKMNRKQTEKVLEHLKKEYDAARINPGESIGIITAESFGQPGTQMSIAREEKIIVKINNRVKVIEIGKLVDYLIEMKGSLKINKDSEILPLNDLDIYVPSLNQDEKIEWKKVIECSRHICDRSLIKIKTRSGREITATDNHSFVTRVDNKIVPMNGKDLKIGIRIPVINYLSIENNWRDLKVDVKEFVKEDYIFENEKGILVSRYKAKSIPRFVELDESTGWFFGAYLAEGTVTSGQVVISNINDSYISNAERFLDKIGLDYKEDLHSRGFSNSRDLKIYSSLLARFIRGSCSKGSRFKKIPDFAFNANNKFVSGLLRGYFDGDGNFHVSRKMIRASSNSKELISGIALLLSRFRIFSYKIRDKKGQYWLLIPYKYAPLFLEFIGSDIDYKLEALEKLAELSKNYWNEKSLDYTDMISGFGDLFYNVAKKLGMRTEYVNNFTNRQRIGRATLFRYIKKFENLAKEEKVEIDEELEIMRRMFNSDVVWDEIVDIENVDHDCEYVYDLSVPGLETFTTFDGIITHNTLNVFHFAGVAEVAVTQGLPRLIEILDARKSISTPTMQIYLNKPYNKDAEEVRRIASLIKETRLNELVTEFSINLSKMQIEITLNKKKMRDLKISNDFLIGALSESVKIAKFKLEDDMIVVKVKEAENELMETYKLKEKLKDVFIKGVKGIKQVLPIKEDNEFVIITAGSNLKDTMEIKEVDETRVTTNDLFEVEKVLGIEAARQTIINEAAKVIEDQGLDVNIRHIMLIADVMTGTGVIKGITRSGITGEKRSILARASFETPLRHIINASLIGEEDPMNSVIENVMVNQQVPVGTGLPGLVAKMKDVDLKKKESKEDKDSKDKNKDNKNKEK